MSLVAEGIKDGKAYSANSGTYAPEPDTLTIESVQPTIPACYTDCPSPANAVETVRKDSANPAMSSDERRRVLEEVNVQQSEFGIK